MFMGGFTSFRSGNWPLWLALRATLAAALAMIVGWLVKWSVFPTLTEQANGLRAAGPEPSRCLSFLRDCVPFVGLPGFALGLAAIVKRRWRPVLAVLATVASFAALLVIVGTLISALKPLYQTPQ